MAPTHSRDPLAVLLARVRAAGSAMANFHHDHKVGVRQQRNGFYRPFCRCGWEAFEPSSSFATATRQGIYHLSKAADEYGPEEAAKNGVSVPETVGVPAQDQVTS